VYLAAGILAQQANGEDRTQRIAFKNRQIRLVDSYRDSGDYQAAERVLREWLGSEPAGSASRLMVQNALADLLREEGRREEPRQLFSQIVDAARVTPQLRLSALIGLADVDLLQGDWRTSVDEGNTALEIARGEGDTQSEAIVLRGLGRAWLRAGSAARAEPLLRESLSKLENDAAPPLQVAESLGALAEYYRAGNKLALAEDSWSRALSMKRALFGEAHPQVASLLERLADVYSARGETSLACDYATRAADIMRQWFGEASPPSAAALANLAVVEQRAHALDSAANHYQAAVRVLRRSPELLPTLKIVMQRYAGLLKAMHRDREAKALDTEVKAFRSN
jgi:tetratricopeptide (TPR) repeat protein